MMVIVITKHVKIIVIIIFNNGLCKKKKKLIDRSLSSLTSREITQQRRCSIQDSRRLTKIIIQHNIIINVPMQILLC